ncbi:MAG: sortase family protein [Bryobacterales bacterium]|nr:sortase family protein [Bryobacterales bacterium]
MQVRLRFTKSLLRRAERLCFGLGFAGVALSAAFLAQAWFFQTFENWAFEQQLRGEPVSFADFVVPSGEHSVPPSAATPDGVKTATLPVQGADERSLVGRIEIPRIGLKAVILEGVAQRTLALAVGHIPGTAMPGKTGNVGIAGHRDTFFRGLSSVQTGDKIVVTTLNTLYEYSVKSFEVVGPRETRVLDDSSEPTLTLVTCYPFRYIGPAPKRFIVHASRVM